MITTQALQELQEGFNNQFGDEKQGCSLEQLVKFNELIDSLKQYADHDKAQLKKMAIDAKHLDNLVSFLESIITKARESDAFNLTAHLESDEIFNEGERLVKALDKGNPKSARAKKYLGFGIAATVFGILWIPALVLAGVYLGPLTAFTYTTTSLFSATQTITAVPVWAVALGAAILPSAAGVCALFSKLTKGGLGRCLSALAIEPIVLAAFVIAGLVGVALMPFIPLIAGGLMLKKAHQLSKAPQGLALKLANFIPGLIEKTHYGDIKETALAKLKKAKQKLSTLKAFAKQSHDSIPEGEIQTAIDYYTKRVSYQEIGLKLLAGGKPKSNVINKGEKNPIIIDSKNYQNYKPSKVTLLAQANNSQLPITVNNNLENLKLSFFNSNYNHVEHAQKVENTLRNHKTLAKRG